MKKENLDIYDLIWTIRGVAREMNCTHNGCVVGDLMIDAVTFFKMENGQTRLWYISQSCTWLPESEDQFSENLYKVSKENDLYTIEKIK